MNYLSDFTVGFLRHSGHTAPTVICRETVLLVTSTGLAEDDRGARERLGESR